MARFRPSYGFATDVAAEAKSPTVKGWLDYLWGGYEEEDLKVTGSGSQVYVNNNWQIVPANTPGGRWVDHDVWARHEGERTIAEALVERRNKERAADTSFLADIVSTVAPEPKPDVGPKNIPWKKLAVVTVGLGVAYIAATRFLPARKAA